MPCATTRPCSEELVAVLPCPPRLRGILGQVSSTLSGSCGPIPQIAAAQHAAREAPSMKHGANEVIDGALFCTPLNLAQTGAAGRPTS